MLEEQVLGEDLDEIAGLASGMVVGRIVEFESSARRAGCR